MSVQQVKEDLILLNQRNQGLIAKANEVTNQNDNNLTSAVDNLMQGYRKPLLGIVVNEISEGGYITKATAHGTDVPARGFYRNTYLTDIIFSEEIEEIGSYAFDGCSALTTVNIPANVKQVNYYSFQNCTALEEVLFKGKPDRIYSQAFNGCSKLMDIYVPWGEGEVESPPWSATNATIHYNTQYDSNGNPIV